MESAMTLRSYIACHFIRHMKKRLSCTLLLFCTVSVQADLDWGGGATRFTNEAGEFLESESGCAVLISIQSGQLIDFEFFAPDAPQDLLTIGAILSDGTNQNRVLAVSREFHSGYLLNSATPDLRIDEQQHLEGSDSEALFILVWDTETFENGWPTDDSYFTTLPLYVEGESSSEQARTSDSSSSIFTIRILPDESLNLQWVERIAEYAGFNTYSTFAEWVESIYQIADGTAAGVEFADSDSNGRSNLEEYAFDAPLSHKPIVEYDFEQSSSGGAGSAHRCEFSVKLRASDSQLAYSLDVSEDLESWRAVQLEFANQQWLSSDESIEVLESQYEGLGVWSVGLLVDTTSRGTFLKVSATIN
jgi:hypothetical protein